MRRVLCVLAVSMAMLLGSSFAVPAPEAGSARGPVRAEDANGAFVPFAYGRHPRQRLLALWEGNGVRPEPRRGAVVVLHGGYWTADRSPHWNTWSARFAEAGFAVFDIEYRRNVDARWPGPRDDVRAALGWIRRRAPYFGVNPGRVFLVGSSAGGHLALNAGLLGAGHARVAGVVGLSAVAEPLRAWHDGAGTAPARERRVRANARVLAGCDPADCPLVWADMSAAQHASAGDPPALLLHSRWDFVPATHACALARAQRARGTRAGAVTVVTVPGTRHGGPLLDHPGTFSLILKWLRARSVTRA
ncbi:alpha/beta hydrolase [Streptomyces iconiensis]|uniref:Alpha/beta hydrolase n=1 Tax=Streptomyces iconiensis TaxID=1384038 RepID=A0ABT7A7V5_9ACTN|nr:alpha/beta hydrolase [Streptomyces iconiensis]MDJ1137395.1 alpha/beta hydrolase [Streptomyces iconiensis]